MAKRKRPRREAMLYKTLHRQNWATRTSQQNPFDIRKILEIYFAWIVIFYMLYFIEDAWTRAVITISCRWTPSDILLPVSLDVRLPLTAFHSILSETSWASELIIYINSFLTRFAPNWYSGSSQEKKDLKQFTFGIALNRLNQN